MTDDNIKAKALALVNEVRAERGWEPLPILYRTNYEAEALFRAIEQHEDTTRKLDVALRATSAACADHVKTIITLKQKLHDFRQEVSDAVEKAIGFCKDGRPASAAGAIGAFVI